MVLKKQKLAARAVALLGCVTLCACALLAHATANPMASPSAAAAPMAYAAAATATSTSAFRSTSSSIVSSVAPSTSTSSVGNSLLYNVHRVTMPETEISEYDDVLRRLGAIEGVDWRLLSAIAYHESRFRCNLVSPAGARGLMQVRPVVARHFKVDVALLGDLETNITLAAKLIRTVETKLNLPDDVASDDRLSLVLACYNAGDGHVAVARKLAQLNGADPNAWSSVSRFLRRGQTTAFVRKVMESYSEYCSMVSI